MARDNLALLAFTESPAPQAVSRQRKIVECNHAFARLFGYGREELVGESLLRLYPSLADYHQIGQRCLAHLQSHVAYEDERFMQHKSGLIFWARARGITLTPDAPFDLMVWSFDRIPVQSGGKATLTPREREVSVHVVNGLTCKEIAARLQISHRTVELHRARLMKKLNAKNTAELVSRIIMVQQG